MFTQLIIEAIAWMGSWRKSQVMEFSRTNGKKVVWLGMKFNSARLIQHSGCDWLSAMMISKLPQWHWNQVLRVWESEKEERKKLWTRYAQCPSPCMLRWPVVYYLRSGFLWLSLAPSKRQTKIIEYCSTFRSSTHFSSSLQLPTKVVGLEINSRTLKLKKANHITCHSHPESVLPRAWTTVSSPWKFHVLEQGSDIKCHVPMSHTGFLFWNHVF